jgi:aminoglycoside phosphotransferase (APT) family kinase protein
VTLPLWTADIEIDEELAARLIAEQFPELAHLPLEPLGLGWDNAVFVVGAQFAFRFPRRRVAVPLIVREIAILPRIAPCLPLVIPAPVFVGAATGAYPWPFAGYEVIGGATACSVAISEEDRLRLAVPLGRFLRALHAIDPAPLVELGLPPDEIARLDHAKRLRIVGERIPSLVAAGAIDGDALMAWFRTHPPEPIADAKRTLVHGDLYARHILVDDARMPTGVIDWGDLHLGDPALDLAIAHSMLPQSAHGAFRDAYGPIDERTWHAARYRALDHAVLELDYGIRADDAGMRSIGSAALQRLGVGLSIG